MSALRQAPELRPVLTCQRLFLGPRPAFDLALAPERIIARVERFGVNQRERPSCGCIATNCAVVMLCESEIEVVGMANVVRAIGASQQVRPKLHGARPSTSSRRARRGTAHPEPGRRMSESFRVCSNQCEPHCDSVQSDISDPNGLVSANQRYCAPIHCAYSPFAENVIT